MSMGRFVKVCGSVSGCFKLAIPKFASGEGKSLGELCCRFLLIQADVPASSADTLANDVVIRLRHVETSAASSFHFFVSPRTHLSRVRSQDRGRL